MKHLIMSKLFRGIVTAGAVFGLVASQAGAQGTVSPDEAREIAKEAYIFHYPLVMYYRTMYLQAIDPESGVGFGEWLHLGTSSPEDTDIVSPPSCAKRAREIAVLPAPDGDDSTNNRPRRPIKGACTRTSPTRRSAPARETARSTP